jgi:hypothetical protein
MDDPLRKLKKELSDQRSTYRRMTEAENEFYASAKQLEMQRHNDAVGGMDENHRDRVHKMKAQEEQYVRQFTQVRAQYLTKKKALVRGFQRDLKRFESINADQEDEFHSDDNVVDEAYADAVVAEIIRIRMISPDRVQPGRVTNRKLRLLAEELEAYIQLA